MHDLASTLVYFGNHFHQKHVLKRFYLNAAVFSPSNARPKFFHGQQKSLCHRICAATANLSFSIQKLEVVDMTTLSRSMMKNTFSASLAIARHLVLVRGRNAEQRS